MKKKFIVFYVHSSYGNYTTEITDFENITDALAHFVNEYKDGHTAYGIMEIR